MHIGRGLIAGAGREMTMGNVLGALSHDAVVVALISLCAALISAIISATVAIYISRSSMRREIKKAQIGSLMEKITDQRIKEYPTLFHIISDMIKVIKGEPHVGGEVMFTKGYVIGCLSRINEWDSRNSIFLGTDTIRSIIWFWHTIYKVIKNYEQDSGRISDIDDCNLLIRAIESLELSLKGEIGIFPLEYGLEKVKNPDYGKIDGRRPF